MKGETKSAGKSTRIPELDGLRALSILLVMVGHLLPLNTLLNGLNNAAAQLGMSLFFALSGFLITQTLIDNDDIFEFAVRRLTRILPLAYLFSIVFFIFFHQNISVLMSMIFFTENYYHENIIDGNGHYWSLCVEIHFYISIAIAVLLGGRRALRYLPILLLTVTALRILTGTEISIITHLRVDEILGGAVLCLLHNGWFINEKISKWFRQYAPRILWIVAPLWLGSGFSALGPLIYLKPYLALLMIGAIIYAKAPLLKALLINPVASYIAKISYALYVFHGALRYGYFHSDATFELYAIKRPQTIALTFLLAHFSTFYWEQYWLNKGKKLIVARREKRKNTKNVYSAP